MKDIKLIIDYDTDEVFINNKIESWEPTLLVSLIDSLEYFENNCIRISRKFKLLDNNQLNHIIETKPANNHVKNIQVVTESQSIYKLIIEEIESISDVIIEYSKDELLTTDYIINNLIKTYADLIKVNLANSKLAVLDGYETFYNFMINTLVDSTSNENWVHTWEKICDGKIINLINN